LKGAPANCTRKIKYTTNPNDWFDSGDWWFIVRYYVVIYAIDYGMFQYKRKTDNTQMNVTCSSEPMLFQIKGFKTINILLIFTVKKLLT
jgi:hypothetical protein